MSGILGILSSPLAVRTITIGDDGTSYGYQNGVFGSLSATTYSDRGGSTRTILGVVYNTGTGNLVLTLSGAVSNTNTAFSAIVIGGVLLTRASATYASPSNTTWTWSPGSNIIGTSGTRVFTLL